MQFGFETAMNEITLVLFTTLAPAGVFACVVMAGVIAVRPMAFEARARISHAIAIPLVVSMVGLVASATHLGNPSNALYVFLGVGRSPLSNEVFSAVVFLAVCGLYWLFSFSEADRPHVHRAWCAAIMAAGAACILGIAFAYDVGTIITWRTPFVPANLILSAFAGGPLLAMMALRVARAVCMHTRFVAAMCGISGAGLALGGVVLVLQEAALQGVYNGYGSAAQLVPFYGWMIAAYLACGAMALLSVVWVVVRPRIGSRRSSGAASGRSDRSSADDVLPTASSGDSARPGQAAAGSAAAGATRRSASVAAGVFGAPSVAHLSFASMLFFAGLFVVRFGFYMMHMTVGLGV